jgi:ABC-type multidrug transport system ATPase subunit
LDSTVLHIKQLSKKYKDVLALDNLNLKVEKGTVFGLLGPNGSGKTTTLGILLGVLRQSEGSYSWFGNGAASENRLRIGALLETPNYYPYLTAIQNLVIVAKIKKIDNVSERIDNALKVVNLYDRRNSNFKTYSLGMKQRLAIAGALLNDPEVLVLDEPTNGLDPQGIAEIRELIIKISKEGKTIIIASHILDEIEKVCTHVAILKIGEIIGSDNFVIISSSDMIALNTAISNNNEMEVSKSKENEITIKVDKDMTTEMINKYFFDKGVVLSKLKSHSESLETQFLEIIK